MGYRVGNKRTIANSKIVLFADDTSVIITNPSPSKFEKSVSKTIQDMSEWSNTNLLSLNLDKTHFIQFVTKNSSSIDSKLCMEITK
jgi:hypothetical protein